jgi:hypothetical protein
MPFRRDQVSCVLELGSATIKANDTLSGISGPYGDSFIQKCYGEGSEIT